MQHVKLALQKRLHGAAGGAQPTGSPSKKSLPPTQAARNTAKTLLELHEENELVVKDYLAGRETFLWVGAGKDVGTQVQDLTTLEEFAAFLDYEK